MRAVVGPQNRLSVVAESELWHKSLARCRSGADKISIGSDSVDAVESYLASGKQKDGTTAIEQISRVYGAQAVVISIDPKRMYVSSPADTEHHTVKASLPGRRRSSDWLSGQLSSSPCAPTPFCRCSQARTESSTAGGSAP